MWQLWFGCCAVSMLVTFCSVTFFSRSRWCNFPFFPEPGQDRRLDENQLADNLARGGTRCKVRGDGQEEQPKMRLQVVTARSQPNCTHLCRRVWPFLSISRILWLSGSHLMNFPSSIVQHNTSSNRKDPGFSWFHLQVGVSQGAALAAACDKPGESLGENLGAAWPHRGHQQSRTYF